MQGVPTQQIIDNYIFLTAGGCGPCRFGMYVTEYRKALRDAGFDGFRVMTFQMAGGNPAGHRQGAGPEESIGSSPGHVVRALIAGDVLNLMAYRMRPYEVVQGSVDDAVGSVQGGPVRRPSPTGAGCPLAMLRCRRNPGVRRHRSHSAQAGGQPDRGSSGP